MTSANPGRNGHDDISAASTVTEDTPLLRSESSSVTARDVSPASDRHPGPAPDQPLGWKRTTCIVLSMWALIFLQGTWPVLDPSRSDTDPVQPAT
jgi:hypothetical protein